MKSNTESSRLASRRNFLKTSALGVGATVVASTAGVAAIVEPARDEQKGIHPGARPIPPVSAPAKWTHETDVVVVGGGGSGLAAAVSAAEHGAKVIVLEKEAFCGGGASLSFIYFVPHQITSEKPDAAIAALFQGRLAATPKTLDSGIIREITAEGPNVIRWMEEMGARFSEVPAANCPLEMGYVAIDPEHPEEGWERWHPHNGRGFTETLEKRARDLGVKIFKESPATNLVVEKGRVIGVVGTDLDKNPIAIRAKVVGLTAGGFCSNEDMIKTYCAPEIFTGTRPWSVPAAQGQGIRMAQGAGAATIGMADLETWDGGVEREYGTFKIYTAANQLSRQKSLQVNLNAERYKDESLLSGLLFTYQAAQVINQHKHTSITIFDSNCITKEDIIAKFQPILCEYPVKWWDEQFEKYVDKGLIVKAETLEELAQKIGLDAVALSATVKRYNEMSDKGFDEDFFKPAQFLQPIRKAPFYAVKAVGASRAASWGGLALDRKFRVLNESARQPIPGLYAAGENGTTGVSIAFSIPGGRLMGKHAAAEALGKNI